MLDINQPRKLGKLPVKHDPRTLKLSRFLTKPDLPPAPLTCDWTPKGAPYGMMLNDQLGDCGIAGMGHLEQTWTGNTRSIWIPPDSLIGQLYQALGGYVPGDPSTDNGTVLLDNLKYWKNTGLYDGAHKIGGFASINIASQMEFQLGVYLFGGVYLGVGLPATAQNQTSWSVVPNAGPDGEPGSWGGHCVCAMTYDAISATVISWGEKVPMTWDFYHRYFDEAYVVFNEEWLAESGNSPSGFNKPALLAALNSVPEA